MKTKLLHLSLTVMIICYGTNSNAQANQTLSNLISPTTINQDLLPDNQNTKDLGSGDKTWRRIYFDDALYMKGSIAFHIAGTNNFFVGQDAGNISVTGSNNTGIGRGALNKLTSGSYNTASGNGALYASTSSDYNTANGALSLYHNTTGYDNTGSGYASLYSNTTGSFNVTDGYASLYSNTKGSFNTASGYKALYSNIGGGANTAYGYKSLYSNTTGIHNTAVGHSSLDSTTTGSGNTALGYNAKTKATVNNSTVIGINAYTGQSNTIILGGTGAYACKVGIGTSKPAYTLSVNGTIQSKEVRVETGWADYVFQKDYKLCSLKNVAGYIEQNKHLPGIPSAKEIQKNGLAVGEMQTKMMEKIEELTLYIIELQKQIDQLQTERKHKKY